jgi:hypothetical protein
MRKEAGSADGPPSTKSTPGHLPNATLLIFLDFSSTRSRDRGEFSALWIGLHRANWHRALYIA